MNHKTLLKAAFTFVLISFLGFNFSFGRVPTKASLEYGQVRLGIVTESYGHIIEDVKLLAKYLNDACIELKLKDTIYLDFHHTPSFVNQSALLTLSNKEPLVYDVRYLGHNDVRLERSRHSDSLNLKNIDYTIRVLGHKLDLKQAFKTSLLLILNRKYLDTNDFTDSFNGSQVFKSIYRPQWSVNIENSKRVIKLANELLSKKQWLNFPNRESNLAYYFKDSVYYVVETQDSNLIDSSSVIHSISAIENSFETSYLFLFSSPIEFKVTSYTDLGDTHFFTDQKKNKVQDLNPMVSFLFETVSIKEIFNQGFLFDYSHSILGQEGPFVIYDFSENKILGAKH